MFVVQQYFKKNKNGVFLVKLQQMKKGHTLCKKGMIEISVLPKYR